MPSRNMPLRIVHTLGVKVKRVLERIPKSDVGVGGEHRFRGGHRR